MLFQNCNSTIRSVSTDGTDIQAPETNEFNRNEDRLLFTIDSRSKKPIYEQIVDNVVMFVATSVWSEGEKIPSIRAMAQELGVNANTVARAYTELEHMNVIASIPKSGSVVTGEGIEEELVKTFTEEALELVSKYSQMGIEIGTIENILEETVENVKDK